MTQSRRHILKTGVATTFLASLALGARAEAPMNAGRLHSIKRQQPGEHLFLKGNSTIIGWEGDKDAAIVKENGWILVRDGINTMASYTISAYPQPGKYKWYPHSGYLPCFVTEFEDKKCLVKISNFSDKVTINAKDFVITYSRVSIENPTQEDIKISPRPSSILTLINNQTAETVKAGQGLDFDYAVVTDRFGGTYDRPTATEIVAAGTWDTHFEHMKAFWMGKLKQIVALNTPDPELNNAYRMGFIYTLITKDGRANYNTGEFGYDIMYNHDYLGILTTLFKLGYYDNAHEQIKILGQGVGDYRDQYYRWCLPLSVYLQKTNDLKVLYIDDGFVYKQCEDAYAKTMSDINPATGILKSTWNIDEDGLWTWDNESALTGFACYAYVARLKGDEAVAKKSDTAFTTMMGNINSRLTEMTKTYGINYIPASLEKPNENLPHVMNKGSSFWATPFWFGMNWDTYLAGGVYKGPILDRIDTTFTWGFDKLKAEGFAPHNFGTWVEYGGGVSSCYNSAFAISGLFSRSYRQEAIKSYQFLLEYGQSAPYGFWEMFHEVDPNNPWAGKHPAQESNWYCCPHQWGQAGATQALMDACVAEFYDGRLLIGRGYIDEWCQAGKVTEVNNFPIHDNNRANIKIEFTGPKTVKLSLSGARPKGKVWFNLPCFENNIEKTSVGKIDQAEGMVALSPSTKTVTVTLKKSVA